MRIINIGGKDYRFEFSIEASLSSECVEKTIEIFGEIAEASEKGSTKDFLRTISKTSNAAFHMFYAGLMEHHGIYGDKTVLNIRDAINVLKIYMNEHRDDEKGSYSDLMILMMEIMKEDGFFKMIGLDLAEQTEEEEKLPKTPQDHKRKSTKATEK